MLGNSVVDSLIVPIFVARGAALILVMLVMLLLPPSSTTSGARTGPRARGGGVNPTPDTRPARPPPRLRDLLTNPWGRTRFLWAAGIGYLVWSLIPVADAVLFSFNSTRSNTQWASLLAPLVHVGPPRRVGLERPQPATRDRPEPEAPRQLTALIAVPLGVAFALSLHHWRGRGSGSANFLMLFAFVTPELILAVSLFLLFINVFEVIGLGTASQLIGLVVLGVAYPVVIVRARLLLDGGSGIRGSRYGPGSVARSCSDPGDTAVARPVDPRECSDRVRLPRSTTSSS